TANGQIVVTSGANNINSAKNDGTAAYWTNDLRSITPNSTPIAMVDSMLNLFGIGGGGDYCDTITYWDWNPITSGISYGDPPEWMAMAIKLTQDELSAYTGRYIRNVIFQLRTGTNPANDARVIILGDTAAGDTLAIVPFTVRGDSGWYTVPLGNDSILISATDTFWVMVGFTYEATTYPFPVNSGSYINFKSDWAWTNTGGWEDLGGYGLLYGWCLGATTCPQNGVEEVIGSPVYPFDVRAITPIGRKTAISFSTPYMVNVNVNVFDVTGRIVENLFQGSVQGQKTFEFASDVPGMYFYQVNASGVNYTGKLTIID
ncbi:T9SS type A sorting domain-containing protein, partial [candidate division WOR-3 bacterium]|nr:T9SS type A sorting domain-containing protein [candidate division WOR-3 bacterium]